MDLNDPRTTGIIDPPPHFPVVSTLIIELTLNFPPGSIWIMDLTLGFRHLCDEVLRN